MFNTGTKVKFLNNDAIILTDSDEEVLIYVDTRYIKWVDKSLISIGSTKKL